MNRPTAAQAVQVLKDRHDAYYKDGVIYRGDPGPVFLGGQEPHTPIGGVKEYKDRSNRWHMRIKIGGKVWMYYRSHIVWAWHDRELPDFDDNEWTLDHINEDALDDRIENLRLLTRSENIKVWLAKDGRSDERVRRMNEARLNGGGLPPEGQDTVSVL